jgi:hypothetical protein
MSILLEELFEKKDIYPKIEYTFMDETKSLYSCKEYKKSFFYNFKKRLIDAIGIIMQTKYAFHYAEDDKNIQFFRKRNENNKKIERYISTEEIHNIEKVKEYVMSQKVYNIDEGDVK